MSIVLTTAEGMVSAAVASVLSACASKAETRKGSSLQCEIKDKVVTEPLAIARLLVRGSSHPELLGEGPTNNAKVEELLGVFQAIVLAGGQVDEGILGLLNDSLQTSTCLAGNNITIADVMLFQALRNSVVKLVKEGSVDKLCHLVRWFDYIQYLPYVAALPVPIRALGLFDVLGVTINAQQETKTRPKKAEGESTESSSVKPQKVEQTKEKDTNGKSQPVEGAKEAGSKGKKAGPENNKEGAEKTNNKPAGEKKPAKEPKKDVGDNKAEAKEKGAKDVPTAQVLIGRVDVRVGLIKTVSKHPTVDTMYVTEIDVGTGSIPVVTGVAAFFTPEQLVNKKVCVIVNLGSAPCKGVDSAGRILCATSADGKTKEILEAPAAAKVGESLTWPGVVNAFDDPVSSKNFSKLAKELSTNAERQAVYRNDFLFTSSAGVITLPTIANGTVA